MAEDPIVTEFRENGGLVRTHGFGRSLVLLHTRGARTGAEHVNPVRAIPDGAGWLIIASAGGAPKNPGWYHNLRADPDAEIETGEETVPVRAVEVGAPEWESAFARFVEVSKAFLRYRERADRHLPIFRLERR
jgi:deazaflavin-dependent oxidoreductase (nitroreductase family)